MHPFKTGTAQLERGFYFFCCRVTRFFSVGLKFRRQGIGRFADNLRTVAAQRNMEVRDLLSVLLEPLLATTGVDPESDGGDCYDG